MITLRSNKTQIIYDKFLNIKSNGKCYLCEAITIYNFKNWKIVANEYPYDKIAKVNHIISTRRHIDEESLTEAEIKEFSKIKKLVIDNNYDMIFENTRKKQSVPGHHHLQLIEIK